MGAHDLQVRLEGVTLLKLPNPPVQSVWTDNTLDITMIVQGIVTAGPSKGDVLVTCRHEQRQWDDAIPTECFATELRPVK